MENNWRTIHIVLTGNDYDNIKDFPTNIKHTLYDLFRSEYKKALYPADCEGNYPACLYDPKQFLMFGSNELGIISIIDDLEFAQKNFSNKDSSQFSNSYQIFTGFPACNNDYKEINSNKRAFIGIINIKLNNAFLIGNGKKYFDAVVKKISDFKYKLNEDSEEESFDSSDCYILQSMSWFEITVVVFDDNITKIKNFVRALRRWRLSTLSDDEKELEAILNDSLYSLCDKYKDTNTKQMFKKGVFSDTQTHIGVSLDLLYDNDKFKKICKLNENLKLQFELHVKPSNLSYIADQFNQIGIPLNYFISGKYDFTSNIIEKDSLSIFKKLYDTIIEDPHLAKKLRKIKTKILTAIVLDDQYIESNKDITNDGSLFLLDLMREFTFVKTVIEEIETKTKSLKISRQVRKKIIKIIENYNEFIRDPILYIYFIEFYRFISALINEIRNDENLLKCYKVEKVNILEQKYLKYINTFEGAYSSRSVNSFRVENYSNNSDLDYNSSIEQLLSSYNTLYSMFSIESYEDNSHHGPLLLYNLDNTISHKIFVNFHIYHLLNPEFVYTVFIKELLNSLNKQSLSPANTIAKQLNDDLNYIHKVSLTNSKLSRYISYNTIESELQLDLFNYYIIDFLRYQITFDSDINKFAFWFWSYNMQNHNLYNTDGTWSRTQLHKEMFRFYFLCYLTENEDFNRHECPLPELENYWIKYKYNITEFIRINCENMRKAIISKNLFRKESNESIFQLLCEPAVTNFSKEFVANEIKCQRKYLDEVYNYFDGPNAFAKLKFLRRNWHNGDVEHNFLKRNNSYLYYVDQFGGIYYDILEKKNNHIKLKIEEIRRVWDRTLIVKKEILNSIKRELEINKLLL